MINGYKETETYKQLKSNVEKEYGLFTAFNDPYASILVLISIVAVFLFAFNYIIPVWDLIAKPQETIVWYFLAFTGCSLSLICVFFGALISSAFLVWLLSWIFYHIKFEILLHCQENYDKIVRDRKKYLGKLFIKFTNYSTDNFDK